jgi:hypothetical protein
MVTGEWQISRESLKKFHLWQNSSPRIFGGMRVIALLLSPKSSFK